MTGSVRVMAVCTVVVLVLITAYSTVLDAGVGWLWFCWVVLALLSVGTWAVRDRRRG
ncbi:MULTISPECIES: hypothetical protein [Streptomycetaceae]|uniref:Integral membrane protein n=1 Tax=Streptantibioticus cattleyicolor (strain ATCC 35852 / DSM 46488 / JCM 4925 / NBRC 14057 / NRRL 8057) TaxID=1003195 RepID=F8JPM2_STREN|nr:MULTISPECIES: hypothetical protein [Streptomycetaceae]AEW92714.1 hypothetical protein SCATT_03430 [Streptantibioticus cattleyicolor NRRL 8057 = DSM 46488]CCB73068.1 conserved exported protein of unknown function [Streptantibioticus cattleyicolor NRRL 8057 = DSM 46488]